MCNKMEETRMNKNFWWTEEKKQQSPQILQGLALGEGINRQLGPIIKSAAEAIVLLKPEDGRMSDMKENQLRNVVNVASVSKGVEVVTNFIRYQIGRSSSGKQWQYNGFGERVIRDIEEGVVAKGAQQSAEVAFEEIEKRNGTADKKQLCEEGYVLLMKQYLGYLNRAFYYCDKMYKTDPKCWDKVVDRKEACENV